MEIEGVKRSGVKCYGVLYFDKNTSASEELRKDLPSFLRALGASVAGKSWCDTVQDDHVFQFARPWRGHFVAFADLDEALVLSISDILTRFNVPHLIRVGVPSIEGNFVIQWQGAWAANGDGIDKQSLTEERDAVNWIASRASDEMSSFNSSFFPLRTLGLIHRFVETRRAKRLAKKLSIAIA